MKKENKTKKLKKENPMLKRFNTMMLENIKKEETRKKIYKNFDKVNSNKVELMN